MTGIAIKITPAQWDSDADRVVILAGIAADTAKMVGEGKTARWVLTEWENKRSLDQNRMLHAVFGDVARGMTALVKDEVYSTEDAKEYLLQVRYGLEVRKVGKVEIPRRKKTSEMSIAEACDFITWCLAWAADRSIAIAMPTDYAEWSRQATT